MKNESVENLIEKLLFYSSFGLFLLEINTSLFKVSNLLILLHQSGNALVVVLLWKHLLKMLIGLTKHLSVIKFWSRPAWH